MCVFNSDELTCLNHTRKKVIVVDSVCECVFKIKAQTPSQSLNRSNLTLGLKPGFHALPSQEGCSLNQWFLN